LSPEHVTHVHHFQVKIPLEQFIEHFPNGVSSCAAPIVSHCIAVFIDSKNGNISFFQVGKIVRLKIGFNDISEVLPAGFFSKLVSFKLYRFKKVGYIN
jgi:hypothetical protein